MPRALPFQNLRIANWRSLPRLCGMIGARQAGDEHLEQQQPDHDQHQDENQACDSRPRTSLRPDGATGTRLSELEIQYFHQRVRIGGWNLRRPRCYGARLMPTLARDLRAFIAPFVVFMLLLAAVPFFDGLFRSHDSLFLSSSKYWIFPLQTVVCGGILWWFWPCYQLKPVVGWAFTLAIAVLVLAIWIAPQELLGWPARIEGGFDPTLFEGNPALFAGVVFFRFVRLVVVVPLLEEIFWRGFLLRDTIHPRFTEVPLGTFTWKSFAIVSVAFGLAHWGPDFIPALITGALYNLVAYRTKSLSACVVAHAVTNLLLGFYIMRTGQWGFW